MKRFVAAYVVPTTLLLVWVSLPLIRGTDTLFLRDVFNTHLEKKWVQAQAMRAGYLPLVDPYRDGGQPHLGNPNTVPLYPDNLLFLVASTFWAFNAHFWVHLLLAPFAFFWLGRAWGLRRESAWAAAACFAVSGYFLSNLSFYNLVAGTVWTPVLAAGLLRLAGPDSSRRDFLAVGAVWTLLLLSGDPMTAVIAVGLAASGALVRWGFRGLGWGRCLLALVLGTLIAAPQWVEFLRILPLSYRGYLGYSQAAATAASWPPVAVIEWFLPFFFGPPDLSFWGQPFHGGELPLFPTLYPGLLALILISGSGRPSSRAARWSWLVIGLGVFLALGKHNVAVGWLLQIPGMDLLRLPAKFWLLVAVGSSLLCGLGFERLMKRSAATTFWRIVGGLAVVYLLSWLALGGAGRVTPAWLEGALAGVLSPERLGQERLRWAGHCLLSLAALGIFALAYRLGRKRLERTGAVLVALHVATQLLLLRPVLAMDDVAVYRQPPELLELVPEESLAAHGRQNSLFGSAEKAVVYPGASLVWLQRRVHEELYPVAGTLWGRRYEFSSSAEGLDAFLTRAVAQSFRALGDADRVRLLAASGVDILLLDRELAAEVGQAVRLLGRRSTAGGEILVYRLVRAASPVQFVGKILRAPHLNAALTWLTAEDLDPRTTVVLPEGGPTRDGPAGEVVVVRSEPEHLEVRVAAPVEGVLIVQRAFLPIYRATANGRRVPIVAANMHRLGIELPAGDHVVTLSVDRRTLRVSLLVALTGLVMLIVLARRLPRRRHC